MLDSSMSKQTALIALVSALLAGLVLPLAAQTASLAGEVHDASQGVVASANVLLTSRESGAERRVTANASGYYLFAQFACVRL
jgi:hypothetical protein